MSVQHHIFIKERDTMQDSTLLTSRNLQLAYETAHITLSGLMKMPGHSPKDLGGWLALGDCNVGIQAILKIGYLDFEQSELCFNLVQEKFRRLQSKPKHRSSHESRDEANQKYGGAIKCFNNTKIVSCSGLTQSEDETISLMTAISVGWTNISTAREIASISDNTVFTDYVRKYYFVVR